MTDRHLVASGFLVGKEELVNFLFEPNRPYSGCMLCGEVYQTQLDRQVPDGHLPSNSLVARLAKLKRDEWRRRHTAQVHPNHDSEVRALKLSGRWCTPEALQKFVTLGIVPMDDLVLSDEHAEAGREAPRTPIDDVEGSR